MKTKAAVLYKLHSPLVIEELTIPPLKRGQVLVKMLYSGICRTQFNETIGIKGPDIYLPHLIGHEASAIVCAVGSGVTKVANGDYVVASWMRGTGLKQQSTHYLHQHSTINSGAIATFAQHAVISENCVFKISNTIAPDIAALLGCAVPTGAGIVLNTLEVKQGSTIAIFGVGGIGLSAILGAKMRRCKEIIAIDINDKALALATKVGATTTVLFGHDTIPNGIDYVIEASGNKIAMEQAFAAASDTATIVIAGNIAHDQTISIQPFDLIKGKKLIGTWGGESNLDRDLPHYITAHQRGTINLDLLIGKKFRLTQINKAMDLFKTHKNVGRMLIDFT